MNKCKAKCEVYSRVCGYFRPVTSWNHGKKEEFKDRKTFRIKAGTAVIALLTCLLSGCATEKIAEGLTT